MDPGMDAYIRANRGQYTDEAIRGQLIAAGHDAGAVDRAFEAIDQGAAPLTEQPGPPYWRWVFGVNGAVLVVVTAALLIGGSTYAWPAFVVLGIVLLIAIAITGSIGRVLLPRTSLTVALLLPLITALLLGGWCLAGMQGSVL